MLSLCDRRFTEPLDQSAFDDEYITMIVNNTTGRAPERVPEHIVRGVALIVFILSAGSVILGILLPLQDSVGARTALTAVSAVLAVDFALRALGWSKASPLAFVSRALSGSVLRFRKRMITAKPKRFAAAIGAVMSIAAFVSVLAGAFVPALVFIGALAFFSFLEAAFSFCVGCKIFAGLVRIGILRDEVCVDCVYPEAEGEARENVSGS